jgi:hypothetical protein
MNKNTTHPLIGDSLGLGNVLGLRLLYSEYHSFANMNVFLMCELGVADFKR